MWEHYQLLQKQCDVRIEKILNEMTSNKEEPQNQGSGKPIKKRNKPMIEDFHLSSFYKRIRARAGKMVAIKATARKIAVYFYNLLTKGIEFVEEGIKKYEQRYLKQQEKFLQQKASEMGYLLVKV